MSRTTSKSSGDASPARATASNAADRKAGDVSKDSPYPAAGEADGVEEGLRKLSLRSGEGLREGVDAIAAGAEGGVDGQSRGGGDGRERGVSDNGGGVGGCDDGAVTEEQARNSLLASCRASYAHAVLTCPQNLRWKVTNHMVENTCLQHHWTPCFGIRGC